MQKHKHFRPIYFHYLTVLFRELLAWNVFTTLFIILFNLANSANNTFVNESANHKLGYFLNAGPIYWAINNVALLIWVFENFIFARIMKSKGVARAIITRIVIYLLSFFLMAAMFTLYFTQIFPQFESPSLSHNFIELIQSPVFIITFILGMLINIIINYNRAINRFVGFRNMRYALFGWYKVPKEEHRIFLFIDLVSSTYVAEKLGHEKYSAFLQDCYNSFSDLIIKYRAQVYQFVGDEVLLTWKGNKPKNFMRAVEFYYDTQEIIKKNGDEYLSKYGLIPEFNASLNFGKVMVAEVGEIKTEFAYHGDVLNTGARIQKMCKQYKKSLVASSFFIDAFRKINDYYQLEYIDKPLLRGKQETVAVYAINLPPKQPEQTRSSTNHQVVHSPSQSR
jgi:adenylate cyclase